MEKHRYSNVNLEELLINKRKGRCLPSKLQRFKAPLVSLNDFPSQISVVSKEPSSAYGEYFNEEGDDYSSKNEDDSIKPPITHWRRAENSDITAISKLVEKSHNVVKDLFGEPDIPDLLEKSIISIMLFNKEEQLISFTSVFAYPNIPAVPSFEWYIWLDNTYRVKEATPRNSLFIHYLAWESDYEDDFLRLTLETLFLEFAFLSHLMITRPPKVKIPSVIADNFIQVLPEDSKIFDCEFDSMQTLLICLRHSIMERLKIRLAVVEDHDDLMPVVDQHTDRLRQLYGDFCMAEIIEYPGTSDRKTLVCEFQGYAVGFMNINRAVDFDLLNSQFDLGGFNGLRKPDDKDVIHPEIIVKDEEEPVYFRNKIDPFLDEINSDTILKFLNWQPSLCAAEEDLQNSSSTKTPYQHFNELTKSMSSILHDTLNLKLQPKFSAHALSMHKLPEETESMGTTKSSIGLYMDEQRSVETSSVMTEESLISLQYFNLPVYHGAPNAFCVEFFAMHNNFDERLCIDFIEAAFESFPDLDYCLFTIPSQTPLFPLLELFTRVTPRPLKRFKQELYVCHKSSVMITFMRVRRVTKADLEEINTLLLGIKNKESIYADLASSCYYEDSAYQGFVLVCFKSIVGIAVVCNEDKMEYLSHHYHVSDLIDFDLHKIEFHAILKHLLLSPIYQPHARFFLRDIMRMADLTALYRTRYEEAETNWRASIINVLGQLVPVKPRRIVVYNEASLGNNVPPRYLFQKEEPFSLYHINARICGVKKFTSNINVVVVGSSRTAFSFLESVFYSPSAPYVTYNNFTLVSPHGIGTEYPSHPARDFLFPFRGKYSRYYKIQVCLKTFVNFVYGVMTQINRADKYITINNDSTLPYDYLILLCGKQYFMPVPCSTIPEFKECRRNYRPRCSLFKYLLTQQNKEEEYSSVYPGNVFAINDGVDGTNAFLCLQYLIHKRGGFNTDEKVIVYGHHFPVYLCTQALLKYGIPPEMIIMVEPFPQGCKSVSCFKDPNVDKAVLDTLDKLKVKRYESYVLYDWKICNNNQVETATFHSDHRKVTIKCLAMFPYDQRLVAEVTFKAVNEASLVYDGKLVINSSFQTNDEYIYAAGSMTKYKRKYYASERNHKHFNSTEIGRILAEIIRKKIDPTVDKEKECVEEKPKEMVPEMKDPLLIFGVLPGDYNYLYIRKPGKPKNIESNTTIQRVGDILITGDCEMSKGYGYFKLTLDECGFVSEIMCYTKDAIEVRNFEMLYGKHEKLLNDLLVRFDLGLIQNFYAYFREPWAYAIYHDKFVYVKEENYNILENEIPSEKNEKIIDLVVNLLKSNNWNRPANDEIKEIKAKFNRSKIKRQIIDNVVDFLYYHEEPFPMYATPKILRLLLRDASTSNLHKVPHNVANTKSAIKISEMVQRL